MKETKTNEETRMGTTNTRGNPSQTFSATFPAESPWRPIESAPEDADILLFIPEATRSVIMQGYLWDGVWWTFDDVPASVPSHWMPLPPPPHA